MHDPTAPTTSTTDDVRTDLLIVGAGPTGLAAAIDARRHGLSVRLVERRATRSPNSKALVVHARTMEVLEVLGCADALVDAGQTFRALNVRPKTTDTPVRIDLLERRWGDTRYPFWLSIPQYETERILEARLLALGGSIEWNTELTALEDGGDHVNATLTSSDGTQTKHRARFVLGCDGGRSATRELIGINLPRKDVGVRFALADVKTTCGIVEDEGHVVLSDDGLMLVVPMPERGVWRLIAQVPDDVGTDACPLFDAQGWNELVLTRTGISLGITSVGWNTAFDLTSGVADRFRRGRVFLLGDAGHIHSPVGGQGLNTGVQDAHNLIWKLAASFRPEFKGSVGEALIASYESERRPIALQMVQDTSRATLALTLRHPLARFALRSVMRLAVSKTRVQDRLGRGVGMLDQTTAGLPRLRNPELSSGGRLHDRVDPILPTLLHVDGESLLVRPDRIVARPGSLPHGVDSTV